MSQRNTGIDILRVISILLVIIIHASFLFPRGIKENFVERLYLVDGVSLFFSISGYLMAVILFKPHKAKGATFASNFIVRRWFRTLPAYYTIIVGLALFQICYYGFSEFTPGYLVFAQNLWVYPSKFYVESWSLSVEEISYFLMLCLWAVAHKTGKAQVYKISIAVIIAFALIRAGAYFFAESSIPQLDTRKGALFRLDALFYGVLAYMAAEKLKSRQGFAWLSLLLVVNYFLNQFAPDGLSRVYKYTLCSTVEGFIGMLAVCVFVNADFSKIGKWKYFAERSADHAYVLYLLHYTPIINCAMPILLEHYKLSSLAVKLVIYSISLVAAAWLLRKLIERPLLVFRNRHFPALV